MGELLPTERLVIKDSEWEGYSLWKYIKQLYPHYTKLLVIKELRLKRILVNSSISYFQYKLSLGDIISITVIPEKTKSKPKKTSYLKKEEIQKFERNQILFENKHLIIVYKQPNQVIQPGGSTKAVFLAEILARYSNNSSGYKARFVHRLDRPVSGLMIGAKNAKTHHLLSEALKKRELTKLYQAIVVGELTYHSKALKSWIDDRGTRVKVQSHYSSDCKYSESKISKLKNFSGVSLVELKLVTGRKNQLRAQLAYIGHPILGDRKYYSETTKEKFKKDSVRLNFNANRIALVAYKIGFPNYLVKELELPWDSFTLPKEKNIISKALRER